MKKIVIGTVTVVAIAASVVFASGVMKKNKAICPNTPNCICTPENHK